MLEVIQDAYVALFIGLMVTSMLVSVIVNISEMSDELCTASGCLEARTLLPWLGALAAVVVTLGVARLFGPVFVTPAVASWLLAAPVERAAVLRPRLQLTAAVGGVFAVLVAAAAGELGGFGAGAVVAFALATALVAVCVVGFAAALQSAGGFATRALGLVLGSALWLALVGLAVRAIPAIDPPQRTRGGWWAVVAALGLASGVLIWLALRRLAGLHRSHVAPGGSLAPGLSGALSSLDFALGYDVLLAHRWNAHDAVRSRRGGPSGPHALIWTDLARLRRSPGALVVVAAAVVLPYAVVSAGVGRVVVLVAAGTGFLAGLPLLAALRVITRTPSIARMLPFPTATTRSTTLAVPGIVLLAFGLAGSAAFREGLHLTWADSAVVGIAVGASALASGCRWITGRPPDYSRPLVTTPAGAVPTNLYGSALRGFDILLLTTLPVLIAPTPGGASFSVGLSVVVLAYLIGRP